MLWKEIFITFLKKMSHNIPCHKGSLSGPSIIREAGRISGKFILSQSLYLLGLLGKRHGRSHAQLRSSYGVVTLSLAWYLALGRFRVKEMWAGSESGDVSGLGFWVAREKEAVWPSVWLFGCRHQLDKYWIWKAQGEVKFLGHRLKTSHSNPLSAPISTKSPLSPPVTSAVCPRSRVIEMLGVKFSFWNSSWWVPSLIIVLNTHGFLHLTSLP